MDSQIRKLVKRIYSCYFAHTAQQAINVDSAARAEADADVLDPSAAAFAIAEAQVHNLMKDDSYVRFIKSELYAQQIRSEISKSAHRKDYGIVSWYKTSLKPRLSVSNSKTPATLFRRPAPRLPDSPVRATFCNHNPHSSRLQETGQSVTGPTPNAIQSRDKAFIQTGTRDENLPFDDFQLPDNLWKLSDENEYEDFFCDLLSASQMYPDVRRVKDKGLGRRSNSHPSLADTIGQVTHSLDASPSLDNIVSGLPSSSRSRKGLTFRSPPPPPLPPKAMRRVPPLHPKQAHSDAAAIRTLRV